jgi:transketolase N-terminal domain/subunit
MVYGVKLGHIGGDFSTTDILVALYFDVLRIDPHRPDDPERDRFILSKGHSASALTPHSRMPASFRTTSSRPSRSHSRG